MLALPAYRLTSPNFRSSVWQGKWNSKEWMTPEHQENPEIHMWAYGAYKPPLISCVVAEIYLGYMSYC